MLNSAVLHLDCGTELERICAWLREVIGQRFRRRGAIVALSGGVDSSVCAALAVKALGADKVFGLLLPDRLKYQTFPPFWDSRVTVFSRLP